MAQFTVTISAFGDEIASDVSTQLQVLHDLGVGYLELRSAWDTNVLAMDDQTVSRVARLCAQYGVGVSCIGSPIGKSPIGEPITTELANLRRIMQVAQAVGTRRIRIFSFYPPPGTSQERYDDYVEESASRLAELAALAEKEDCQLLLENEKEIVGDTPERCRAILERVTSRHLAFAWDPANFVQVGVARPMDAGWPLLGHRVAYVHVKDALLTGGQVVPAGQGDGQVPELLTALRNAGYQGFLAVEPHLVIAGHSGGFSGPDGMAVAVEALRALLNQLN
jgi:sugar phosphate isomerase/epimerase